MARMNDNIFQVMDYRQYQFHMQLPWLNNEGKPVVIDITASAAEQLHRRKICRYISCGPRNVLMIPIKPAQQNVRYQQGERPV